MTMRTANVKATTDVQDADWEAWMENQKRINQF